MKENENYPWDNLPEDDRNYTQKEVGRGITVLGATAHIYEMNETYEIHLHYKSEIPDKNNMEDRVKKTVDYLSEEGYLENKKKVNVICMLFKQS